MTTFTNAIVRKPGEDFAQGITTSDLGAPEYGAMLDQHAAYVDMLLELGLAVTVLEALPGYPDAYFVEDVAVITPDVAIITRPGALARRGEEVPMEPVLAAQRPIARIEAPGTLDGGDVLAVGEHLYVGISERTNEAGAEQLGRIVAGYGWGWTPVPVGAGLHLKSSVNAVGKNTLLVTEDFAGQEAFAGFERLIVPAAEAYACNTLLVNGTLITPAGFPETRRLLDGLGMPIRELDMSEARKMDGGLTCLSLRL